MDKFIEVLPALAAEPTAILVSIVFVFVTVYLAWKLPPILNNMNKLVENNTEVVKTVSKSIDRQITIMDGLTKDFAVHGQQTKNIQSDVVSLQDDVQDIKNSMATRNELAVVHNRLDTVVTTIGKIEGKVG